MGLQDVIDSTVNGVKNSYSLGADAFTKINNAVRRGGEGGGVEINDHDEKLKKENPNPEAVVGRYHFPIPTRDALGSAVDGLKFRGSDAWKRSYSLGSAAVSKIDNVLREANGVEKLKEYIPGPEVQEKIGHVLTHPSLTLVLPPVGVGVCNLVGTTLKNQRKTDAQDDEKMCADLEHINKDSESSRNLTTPVRFKSSSTVDEKPEEVISNFMTKGLKVRGFMDNQVVPPITRRMENEGWEK